MIHFYLPRYEDLWFRRQMLLDTATMAYNHAWGGTIDFPESKWKSWLDRWVAHPEDGRFYRYLRREDGEFVGEAAYYLEKGAWQTSLIVYAKHRGRGYGSEALRLLCEAAKEQGITELYDEIALDNPSVPLFLRQGFVEEGRTREAVRLKKTL